jgi:GDP-L-fucose synthase
MDKESKIYVAGHSGMVGGAILRQLQQLGYTNTVTRTHAELDLMDKVAVESFFLEEKPEYVFLAAAKVGGIQVNDTYPADFILENLAIEYNVMDAALRHDTRRVLFLGSSCIFPKECPQPIKESAFLSGTLEETNEAFAVAKIAGVEICRAINKQHGRDYITIMPCRLYGVGDTFDPEKSHVIPGLMQRFHEAKLRGDNEIVAWGTGTPLREFLYVDDLAEAAVFVMNHVTGESLINIGSGEEISIKDLMLLIKEVVGYQGEVVFDTSKPDGMMRQLVDSSKMKAYGWKPRTGLEEGLRKMYAWYLEEYTK